MSQCKAIKTLFRWIVDCYISVIGVVKYAISRTFELPSDNKPLQMNVIYGMVAIGD